ncbi:MAG: CapA family protein, partial [Planctomycetota bacterium]
MRTSFVLVTMLACSPASTLAPRDRATTGEGTAVHFVGDLHFGESYAVELSDRYEEPIGALRPFLATGRVVANLEGTFADPDADPVGPERDFLHWSDGVATGTAAARLNLVGASLANNHAMDFGVDALVATRRELSAKGITAFGAGADVAEARQPLELRDLDVVGAYWHRPTYRRLGFYAGPGRGGVRELDADVVDQVRELKEKNPTRTVVVFPHWGRNYRWRDGTQRAWAHRLVGAGADLVVGHGAHRYQEVERYRGRWILYGLGNAVFLTQGRYARHDAPPYSI